VADKTTASTTVSTAMPKVRITVNALTSIEVIDDMLQHNEHTTLARLNSATDPQFLSSFQGCAYNAFLS
jgi:hypothetical protein